MDYKDFKYPLSNDEKDVILPLLIKGLSNKIGVQSAISANEIIEKLNAHPSLKKAGIELTNVRLRKMIYHIICNEIPIEEGYVLVEAGKKGYYISCDPNEIDTYLMTLKHQADAILARYYFTHSKAVKHAINIQQGEIR